MEWLIWGIFGLLIVSIFMPLVGTWLPGCRHWVLGGFRLRYLAFALLFLVLGGSLVIRGLLELDWGSLAIGIVMLVWGGVWLYGRGGIGPGFMGSARWPPSDVRATKTSDDDTTNG